MAETAEGAMIDIVMAKGYSDRTTSISGQPHPSVIAVFLRPKFSYGRDDRPKYKTLGEYASRLIAVVESRLPVTTGKVLQLNDQEAVMATQSQGASTPKNPNSNVVQLRPQASDVSSIAIPEPKRQINLAELILSAPEMLRDAGGLILSGFDYEANMTSNTAIAVRIILALADRIERCVEECHV